MQDSTFGVALIGCGFVGEKRIDSIRQTGFGNIVGIYDSDNPRAEKVAAKYSIESFADPVALISNKKVHVVLVATPNQSLARYGCLALESGKHAFLEKPGAMSVGEIISLEKHRRAGNGLLCKVGYNMRFHPVAQKIKDLLDSNKFGKPLWVRGAYGHGGRPGYEKEWRFQRQLSGGGEVIDQGVHLIDLLGWWTNERFEVAASSRQNAFYRSTEEDNGYLLLTSASGAHAQFHCSATQWKNLFRMEVGTREALFVWEGLGNSNYGPETLAIYRRNTEGGAPQESKEEFLNAVEKSWTGEWMHFYRCLLGEVKELCSPVEESISIFHILDKVYQGAVLNAGN